MLNCTWLATARRCGALPKRLESADTFDNLVRRWAGRLRNDWLAAVDLGVYLGGGNVGVPIELFEMLAAGIPTAANRELVQGFALPSLALEVPDVPSFLLIAEQWRQAIATNRHRERLTPERAQFVEERRPERHARTLLHMLKVA